MSRPAMRGESAIRAMHPECARWYRLEMMPDYLVCGRDDGTYVAYALDDPRDAVDIYPMPGQLAPLDQSE